MKIYLAIERIDDEKGVRISIIKASIDIDEIHQYIKEQIWNYLAATEFKEVSHPFYDITELEVPGITKLLAPSTTCEHPYFEAIGPMPGPFTPRCAACGFEPPSNINCQEHIFEAREIPGQLGLMEGRCKKCNKLADGSELVLALRQNNCEHIFDVSYTSGFKEGSVCLKCKIKIEQVPPSLLKELSQTTHNVTPVEYSISLKPICTHANYRKERREQWDDGHLSFETIYVCNDCNAYISHPALAKTTH